MKITTISRAFSTIVVAALLAACAGSQPPLGALALARSALVPPVRSQDRSPRGYYLAKFTTEVGNNLPESSYCLKFTSSGTWSAPGGDGFNGTYLISGKKLFASAVGYWSPPVYVSLQGSVNAKQGVGVYIVSDSGGVDVYSGGTFTMTRKRSSGCR